MKQGTPWNLSTRQLLDFPEDSLGFHLGCFLLQHNFEPQPKCEDHDIFHVLTGYKTDTAQEIALQFFLYGNGKRSPFLSLAMGAGYLLYPDQYATFKAHDWKNDLLSETMSSRRSFMIVMNEPEIIRCT